MTAQDGLRVTRVSAPIRSQVVGNIRQAIIDRRLLPGERLVERDLVESMGVSRTSVREALRELAAEGLVRTVPHRGTVVASVDRDEAMQLYRVRATLEGLAGQLFAESASATQRRALRKTHEAVSAAYDRGGSVVEVKDRFFEVLLDGTGNESLATIARSLHARVSGLRAMTLSVPGRVERSMQELAEIMEAIDAQDGERARRACAHHVEEAGRVLALALPA